MTEDQQQLVHHKDFKMKNFCLYNGKKIVKPDIWNITSVELSSDYTSAIIQAESKSNKSEYTLDITPLISNQYVDGLDPYSSTIVNELTGVSDWVLDSSNDRVLYYEIPDVIDPPLLFISPDGSGELLKASKACAALEVYQKSIRNWTKVHSMRVSGSGTNYSCVFEVDLSDGRENIKSSSSLTYASPAEIEEIKEKSLPLETVAQKVISNAAGGDTTAQNSIVSIFNNITDSILTSDYSEFFEQNKQPK